MVRQVDSRWNQVYLSSMLMYAKLARFGLNVDGGGVTVSTK
jgi:hypothetical protein